MKSRINHQQRDIVNVRVVRCERWKRDERERLCKNCSCAEARYTLAAYTGTYSTNKLEAVESVNFIIIIMQLFWKTTFYPPTDVYGVTMTKKTTLRFS